MKRLLITLLGALFGALTLVGWTPRRLVVVADPQVYKAAELDSVRRAAADIGRLAADGVPTVGIVLGDVVGTIGDSLMRLTMEALRGSGIEWRWVVGNHDLDTDTGANSRARRTFGALTGAGRTWYSFELEGVHVVVLDDVFMLSRGVARYVGYIAEEQLEWLERDLKDVPEGSVVAVCVHIPTWSRAAEKGEWSAEELNKVVNNRESLYRILAPFRVHVLAGHEHYQAFYRPAAGVEEHVHAPLSTYFWETDRSMDGIPAGYTVYEAAGGELTWYFKAVDYDRTRQFEVERRAGSAAGAAEELAVNVWNWDDGCSVEWWEDGRARGAMERVGADDAAEQHAGNDHKFTARTAAANVMVKFTDRFGRVSRWSSAGGYAAPTRVVAHRGVHTNDRGEGGRAAPENSVASFRGALGQGFYGAEADFYVTADDRIVSFHDATVPGMDKPIEQCTLAELRRHKLPNGERLPRLEDYIEALKKNAKDPKTIFIVEIKTHSTAARNNKAADLIIKAVEKAGLGARTEFIAFDYELCKHLAARTQASVGYLNGDRPPAEVRTDGIDCIDYNQGVLWAHPEWIDEAKALGLTVNVWTVNDPDAIDGFVKKGVDLITTDYPKTMIK